MPHLNSFIKRIRKRTIAALDRMERHWTPTFASYELRGTDEGESFRRLMREFGLKELHSNSRFVFTDGTYVFKFDSKPFQNQIEATFFLSNPTPFKLDNGREVTFPQWVGAYWDMRLIVVRYVSKSGEKPYDPYPDNTMLRREMLERYSIRDMGQQNYIYADDRIVVVDCGYHDLM